MNQRQPSQQSTFGLGLAALGRPGYINLGHAEDLGQDYAIEAMRSNAHQVLDHARNLGVRYFDAARSYGLAEEFLATWINSRGIHADEIRVGSKWGYTYTADWKVNTPTGIKHEVKRHELDVLQKQIQFSKDLLHEHLDLYQIHSATLESGVLSNQEVLQCLNQLRNSGLEIGLSVSGANQSETIEKALTIRYDEQLLFSSVQATWNVLETSATESLQKAHEAGMKVIVKESLANGRLTSRNDAPDFAEKRSLLDSVATELNASIDAVAIAAVCNQEWATTVLSGAATPAHLESNLRASEIEWTQALSERLAELVQSPEVYWATRSRLPWN